MPEADPRCAASSPAPALRLRGIRHAFARQQVLETVDLDIVAGEVVALVGPSGCGKTTLMNLCAGLLRADEGEIDNGFAKLSCVFQQPRLLPWKSALDNIALGLAARGVVRDLRDYAARELALRLGLTHADLAKFPHQLSGGMQSRVSFARALVLDPDLLLLDEPFSALDVGLREELYRLVLAHLQTRRLGVLLITHDLAEAIRLSDRILVMAADPGRIVSRFDPGLPAGERSDEWIYRKTAELLGRREVRASFGLPLDTPHRGHAAPLDTRDEQARLPQALPDAPGPAGAPVLAFPRRQNRC